jgi:membrane protein implicated in regulation of membrane protease activity
MTWLVQLYAVHPFWVWVAAAAVLLTIEVSTGSGYLLWPAASAAVVALLTGFGLGAPGEVIVFAVLTIVSTLAARRWLPHPFLARGPDINDPHHRIVGRTGRAASAFQSGHGRVFVDGKEWAAELEDGGELASGAHVRVTGVLSGACLKVKAG